MKPIQEYEGIYSVTKQGKVYSHKRKVFLKPCDNNCGYLHVSLCKDGKQRTFYVHRLIASAYLNHPPNKNSVNHKDGNKINNHLENLEWVTQKENIQHAIATGLFIPALRYNNTGSKHPLAKLTEQDVLCIRELFSQGGRTHASLGEQFGVKRPIVTNIVNRKSWTHV